MLERLAPYVRADQPESPKALVLWQSAAGLLVCTLAIGLACAVRIIWKGDVGSGSVAALGAVAVPLAGLAGFHRVQDPGGQP